MNSNKIINKIIFQSYCLFNTFKYILLQKIYKFDKWHVRGNYYCRSYKSNIIDFLNKYEFENVVEVGCGLGDILSRVKSKYKLGIDSDINVIKAASFLHSGVDFKIDSFENLCIDNLVSCDLLILINWIHNLDPITLENKIISLSPRFKYLLVESIEPNCGYLHSHKFEIIKQKFTLVEKIKINNEPRIIYMYYHENFQ